MDESIYRDTLKSVDKILADIDKEIEEVVKRKKKWTRMQTKLLRQLSELKKDK